MVSAIHVVDVFVVGFGELELCTLTPVGEGCHGNHTSLFCTTKQVTSIEREILQGVRMVGVN